VSAEPGVLDPLDARRAVRATGLLAEFNAAGVLAAADVHVAHTLRALAGSADDDVLLAAALAVRGPRLGHVRVDLETIHQTAAVDADETVDVAALPWPEPGAWIERLAGWPLVAVGDDAPEHDRPLRLVGTALYLDRYWREERRVAADLRALADAPPADVLEDALAAGLARLFAGDDDASQRLATASAVLRRLAVVAGGPGTGKTTTVARIVALLLEQPAATPPLVTRSPRLGSSVPEPFGPLITVAIWEPTAVPVPIAMMAGRLSGTSGHGSPCTNIRPITR